MFEGIREAVMAIEAAVLPLMQSAKMSVVVRIADSNQTSRQVRKVPESDMADVVRVNKKPAKDGSSIQP
jgi:hypothetical protein